MVIGKRRDGGRGIGEWMGERDGGEMRKRQSLDEKRGNKGFENDKEKKEQVDGFAD